MLLCTVHTNSCSRVCCKKVENWVRQNNILVPVAVQLVQPAAKREVAPLCVCDLPEPWPMRMQQCWIAPALCPHRHKMKKAPRELGQGHGSGSSWMLLRFVPVGAQSSGKPTLLHAYGDNDIMLMGLITM